MFTLEKEFLWWLQGVIDASTDGLTAGEVQAVNDKLKKVLAPSQQQIYIGDGPISGIPQRFGYQTC